MYSGRANVFDTCRDQAYIKDLGMTLYVAGCTCSNEGEVFSEQGECIPVQDCTCYDDYALPSENPIKKRGDISRRGCANW